VARMTVCASSVAPSEKRTVRASRSHRADDVPRGDDLGTEPGGLPPGPLGELCTRDAVGKAEVILDARTLTAWPPVAVRSIRPVRIPREAPYTAAPNPQARHDHDEVVEVLCRDVFRPPLPVRCRCGSISASPVSGIRRQP